MKPLKLALIGLGEQSRWTHLPCIDYAANKGIPITIAAAVDSEQVFADLDSDTRAQLEGAALVEVAHTRPGTFNDALATDIVARLVDSGVNAALVASEPVSHGAYIRALENAGITYHVDKPFLCRRRISTETAASDEAINELMLLVTTNSSLGSVNVSRRFDPLTRRVHALLRETTARTGARVTNISAYYADGEYRTVQGCVDQEQHPFKYGYGALNHSGYHAVDTAVWLADLDTVPIASVSVAVQSVSRSVFDYLGQSAHITGVLDNQNASDALDSEYDCTINASISVEGLGRTLLSLSIVHDSVSNRRWLTPRNVDERLHLGRLSDELTTITQGECQRMFIRTGERPIELTDSSDQPLPAKTFYADVVRSPLHARLLDAPVHEVLLNDVVEHRSLEQSNKLKAFMSFVDKFYDGHGTEIQISNHILSQLILILAARSLADDGRVQFWPPKLGRG